MLLAKYPVQARLRKNDAVIICACAWVTESMHEGPKLNQYKPSSGMRKSTELLPGFTVD